MKKAETMLFYLLDAAAGEAAACGFFISPRLALTVSHARNKCVVDDGIMSARTLSGEAPSFTIRHDDGDGDENVAGATNLDFMVLELCGSFRDRASHFPITDLSSPASLVGSRKVALLACGFAMSGEVQPHLGLSLTVTTASVSHAGLRHFVYDSSWDCDSGGCLFFNSANQVVGLHLEGVNRAREVAEHVENLRGVEKNPEYGKEVVGDAMGDDDDKPASRKRSRDMEGAIRTLSASIRDVIHTVTTGGLSLFLGCAEVRRAIAAAAGGGAGAPPAGAGAPQ